MSENSGVGLHKFHCIYWTGSLTTTNSVNKNVKYNIYKVISIVVKYIYNIY